MKKRKRYTEKNRRTSRSWRSSWRLATWKRLENWSWKELSVLKDLCDLNLKAFIIVLSVLKLEWGCHYHTCVLQMDHNYTKKPIDIENNDQHFMSGESEVEEIISEDREVQDPGRVLTRKLSWLCRKVPPIKKIKRGGNKPSREIHQVVTQWWMGLRCVARTSSAVLPIRGRRRARQWRTSRRVWSS